VHTNTRKKNKNGLNPLMTLNIIYTTGENRMNILMNSKVLITENKIVISITSLDEKNNGLLFI